VYEWSNWVFACHDCNHSKGEKWPPGGYVDPCARSRSDRPETFFDFDTLTGEVLPREDLSPSRRRKAMQMINDLGLNEHHHQQKRLAWLWVVSEVLSNRSDTDPGHPNFLQEVTARNTPLSSITRAKLVQLGYSVDIA